MADNKINKTARKTKAFTLIEVIVVVAIMTLITSVVLVNNNRFGGNVALESLAYEIALTIRQAQFFGMNVRETSVTGVQNFNSGYGVFFDKSRPDSFIFFADLNNNHLYDGVSELLNTYKMKQGNQIDYLCVDNGCSNPKTSTIQTLLFSFKRPDPDAFIKTNNSGDCGSGIDDSCGLAKVFIKSPSDKINDKVITVVSTGQISVSSVN